MCICQERRFHLISFLGQQQYFIAILLIESVSMSVRLPLQYMKKGRGIIHVILALRRIILKI